MKGRIFEALLPLKHAGPEVGLKPWLHEALVGDDSESSLSNALKVFREFDVPESEIALFEDALHVFADGATVVTVRPNPEDKLIFIRNEPYAKVTACLPVDPLLLPIKAGGLVDQISTMPVSPIRGSREITPEERMAIALNRVVFATHDAFHTLLTDSRGDGLNLLVHELDARDVFDHQNVQAAKLLKTGFAQHEHYSKWFSPTRELIKSVVGFPKAWPDDAYRVEVAGTEISPYQLWAQYYEMTYDVLTVAVARPLLLRMKGSMQWVHENMCFLVSRLKEICACLIQRSGQDFTGEYRKITNALDALRRIYFAAFQNSDAASAHLYGVASGASFDELDIANIINECDALLFDNLNPWVVGNYRHRFPVSGKDWSAVRFDGTRSVPLGHIPHDYTFRTSQAINPITTTGVVLATDLIDRLAEQGKDLAACIQEFQAIDSVGYNQCGHRDNSRYLVDRSKALLKDTGLNFPPAAISEMVGISRALLPQDVQYSQNYVLFSNVFTRLRANNIAHVRGHVHSCFSHARSGVRGLSTFMGIARDQEKLIGGVRWRPKDLYTWNSIVHTSRLGIFGVDMNNATVAEREHVGRVWGKLRKNWGKSDLSKKEVEDLRGDCLACLKVMAQMKRRQLKTTKSDQIR